MKDSLIDSIDASSNIDIIVDNEKTVESAAKGLLTSILYDINEKSKSEFKELEVRYKEFKRLHDLIAKINCLTDGDGEVKIDDDLYQMLQRVIGEDQSVEDPQEFKISPDKLKILEVEKKYSSVDRQRLIENIRMHGDNLKIDIDQKQQVVTMLTNQRYQAYQIANAVLEPIRRSNDRKIQGMRGA